MSAVEDTTAEIIPPPNTTTNNATATTTATPFLVSLLAGGVAGTTVDVALFPIDTVKTRLQSPQGFWNAGGFRGIYRGLGAAAAGSAPGAALFFSVYETLKPQVASLQSQHECIPDNPAFCHMSAASAGEAMACLVRVPTEVIKSKMQTNAVGASTLSQTVATVRAESSGVFGGLYRGYGITLLREIPFALIQFPIYERAKVEWSRYQSYPVSPIQAAACGSFGGAIAAAATTPLDVVKTRLMLGSDKNGVPYRNGVDVLKRTMAEEGSGALFRGIQPRVMWISIGGFVFFGAYESYKNVLMNGFY
uniref:S-adenosylmethionine transporter n=1 Tax=Ditylum brightwellii TaxID=49249 RepID=A0A7S2E6B2_9STRA